MLLMCLVVLLPFAISSAFTDVNEQARHVHRFVAPQLDYTGVFSSVNFEVTGVNEFDGTATVRASIDRSCLLQCEWTDRYLIVMIGLQEGEQIQSRPASAVVTVPKESLGVTQLITLPILGDPVRYPFDRYKLAIGVIAQRSQADGTFTALTRSEARRYVDLTLSNRSPRTTMEAPVALNLTERLGPDGSEQLPFFFAEELTFRRPLYIQILAVLLVLLVTAAAAYAVFLRPLDQLIINSAGHSRPSRHHRRHRSTSRSQRSERRR